MNTEPDTSKLVAYWLIVGIPLAWGVFHTFLAASKLFGA
ncbi:MAG: MFS transporter small subunit [Acidiphilium sp.]